jgi:hypothetical protein
VPCEGPIEMGKRGRRKGLVTRKSPARVSPKPGQTFDQANPGRFVQVEGEVLRIKQLVESTWPSLELIIDGWEEEFVLVEHTKTGEEKLCFAVPFKEGLNEQKLMARIHAADAAVQDREGIDLASELEKQQDEEWRRRDKEFGDELGDAGERLLHALKKDGVDAGIPKIFPGEKRDPMNRRLGSGRRLLKAGS